jgi:tRNA pseudouridine32 synthase/23S rRNA pseudouridine746 synthase
MAFAAREVDKRYIAVADGKLAKIKGEINLPLIADWPNRPKQKVDFEVGKPSLTRYKVLSFNPELNATRVELEPVTGRSHQLRVHLLSIGHIILGDDLYAPEAIRSKAPRLLLHASDINLPHPITKERLSFHCPAPF